MKRKLEKAGLWLHRLVFALATLAIAGVLYEGWSLAWYAPVGVLIGAMDGAFLLATVWDFFHIPAGQAAARAAAGIGGSAGRCHRAEVRRN